MRKYKRGVLIFFSMVLLLGLLMSSAISLNTFAYSSYTSEFPGALSDDCTVCHLPGDFGSLNAYGTDFNAIATHATDPAGAVTAIGSLDSDGDGYVNSEEILNETNPGDASSIPSNTPKVPYLEIEDVFKSPEESRVGERVLIYAKILNSGETLADDVTAELYESDDMVAEPLTDFNIPDKETQTVVFALYPEEGIHVYDLKVTYSEGTVSQEVYVHMNPEPKGMASPGLIVIIVLISVMSLGYRTFIIRKGGR